MPSNKQKSKYFLFTVIILIVIISVAIILTNQNSGRGVRRVFGMIQTTLIYGVFYSMMALGFAMIFGAARVINLYHGSFYMLGAYLFATFSNPGFFNFSLGWFVFFQALIVIIFIFFMYQRKKNKKNQTGQENLLKKFNVPLTLIFLGEIPILMLFLRVNIIPGFNLITGLVFSCAFIGFLAILINKYLIEPVRGKTITVLLITISLAFLTQRLVDAVYGSSAIPVQSFVKTRAITLIMGNTIDSKRLLMVIVGIGLIFLVWFIMNKTRIGKGVLAVAQDQEAAELMGVNPGFVYSFTIVVSAILAGFAGIFTTPFLGDARPDIWLSPVIKAFAIVILGGLGSIFGSIVAAFILAFVEKFTKYFISSSLEEFIFLGVIIVILIIRPQGLFGKKGRFE